jgi:hypothetical protein
VTMAAVSLNPKSAKQLRPSYRPKGYRAYSPDPLGVDYLSKIAELYYGRLMESEGSNDRRPCALKSGLD